MCVYRMNIAWVEVRNAGAVSTNFNMCTLSCLQSLSNCDGKTAKELRKLQFLAPGPKALLSDLTPRGTMSAASLAMQRKKLGAKVVI